MRRALQLVWLVLVFQTDGDVGATPVGPDRLSLQGFATLGGGFLDTDRRGYLNFGENFGFDTDTRIGLQLTGRISERFSATAQAVARGSEAWSPKLRWAYLSWQVTDDLKLRGGRLRLPFYLYSDFLEVGYALPWIRPPGELYSAPFSSYEGIDALYTLNLGSWDLTIQPSFGYLQSRFTENGQSQSVDMNNNAGIAIRANRDWLSLRLMYSRVDARVKVVALDPLFADLRGAGYGGIAQRLEPWGKVFRQYGLAAKADYGDWLLVGEVAYTNYDGSILPEKLAWSVTAGRRVDDFTFYYTYAELHNSVPASADPLPAGHPLRVAVDGVRTGIRADQHSHLLGLRYDFLRNTALKLEYQSIHSDAPLPLGARNANLFGIAIEVVF